MPALLLLLFLAGCAETRFLVYGAKKLADATDGPRGNTYEIGDPYQVAGTWYYPVEDPGYAETGVASWYAAESGRTANGETFKANSVSAAHKTLPMPSVVSVTNLGNGRSLKVRVNDRGPRARGRIIALSRRGAELLGFLEQGTAPVRVEIDAEESLRLKLLAFGPQSVAGGGSALPARTKQAWIPTKAPELFVQAGAFVDVADATRVRKRLSRHGPARLARAHAGNARFYRVRVGPFRGVEQADGVLESVVMAGFPQARIIVD